MYGLAGLKEALRQKQKKNKNSEGSGITRGLISGDFVCVNGKSYPYTLAVDVTVHNGQYVWCELYGNRAVVVGA